MSGECKNQLISAKGLLIKFILSKVMMCYCSLEDFLCVYEFLWLDCLYRFQEMIKYREMVFDLQQELWPLITLRLKS